MKRIPALFIAVSLLTASCVGNASLWGEYLTPTPPGGLPSATVAVIVPSQTPTALGPFVVASVPTLTSTPLPTATSEAFVDIQETTSPIVQNTVAQVTSAPTILYYAQSGDWLPAVAKRFGVEVNEIASPKVLPESGLLDPGTLLIIPDRRDPAVQYAPALQLIPDNEVVFSATSVGFDIAGYVKDAGGYLSTYREWLNTSEWTTGAGVIERSAYENSVNPRLLLAILDYEARWVRGTPENKFRTEYPLGYENYRNKGVFLQLAWAVDQLSHGYYGWRTGTMTEIAFSDGTKLQLEPMLNAGTVGLMYLFSRMHSYNEWLRIMDQTSGFASFYQNMFGDPWSRADQMGPIFPPGINQPEMFLPFEMNSPWAFTGGPHGAWEHDGPLAALDFAPAADKTGCNSTPTWITAAAPGLVVRSSKGVVVVDLDGDGSEQTGWNILYLHVANTDRVQKGQWVDINNRIGHASCEGGIATGTHLHLARKYNGEWVIADGPIPFVLSGWTAIAGDKPYQGKLVRGDQIITADVNGQLKALIFRESDGP
ncbi:MAG TPA: M23 family metallopeptidase [Anaerolineales bacterium]|nr:M23 family metallopeptidase [Anaerolineales bacterium]